MAIQTQGFSGVVAEVETTHRASRVTGRPLDHGSLGHYRLGMTSGTIAAALAANGELFQFRWTNASRLCVVQKVLISAGANVAATAAGLVNLDLVIARSWSAAGTGGTAATITGNNAKTRTNMGTTLLGEARCATTAALGAGTKTLDSQAIGNVFIGIGTGAVTTSHRLQLVDKIDMMKIDADMSIHPIVLAQNEGLVIMNGATVWPASMTWGLSVTVVWAEVTEY